MKKLTLILALLLLSSMTLVSKDASGENKIANYDICDFFLDFKPIIGFENLFGNQINALAFFVADKRQPCINYEYNFDDDGKLSVKKISHTYSEVKLERKYNYDYKGRIAKVVQSRDGFSKSLEFKYSDRGALVNIVESIDPHNSGFFRTFDYLKYKFNSKGNIVEVRGGKSTLFGLKESSVVIKVYDYDEQNRLTYIRDFLNPEASRHIEYENNLISRY